MAKNKSRILFVKRIECTQQRGFPCVIRGSFHTGSRDQPMSERPLPTGLENRPRESLLPNADALRPQQEQSSSSAASRDASSRSAPGPKPVLDAAKRMRIVAMVANGSSRRVAACNVGCAPSTITRTAARDPEFAADLARAGHRVEVQALRAIQTAAKNPCHWRAAAWILEHTNPEDFGRRSPGRYSVTQVLAMFAQVLAALAPQLPDGPRAQAVEKLTTLLIEGEEGRERS